MQAVTKSFADYIYSVQKTPIAFMTITLAVDGTGTSSTNPVQSNSQMLLDKLTSVELSRSTDRSSDTCKVTVVDDKLRYASFRSDTNAYGNAFKPGWITNRYKMYLGFQGPNFANPQGISGGSSITNWNFETHLRFTGYLETDDNPIQALTNTKSLSIVDLTKQFRFDIYDQFPHPLYGNQNLTYFDPTYNLTNGANDGCNWKCIGKMFTTDSNSLVYGSTHVSPAFYVDFSCGQTPQDTPLVYSAGNTDPPTEGNGWVATYKNGGGTALWTFDYTSATIVFKDAWVTARIADSGTMQIAKLTANSSVGDTVFQVNRPNLFVVGGTVIFGLASDSHQEILTIQSIQSGAGTITTTTTAAHTHSNGDPAMGNWTVSVSGNPTYMAPENMVRLILVNKGNWDPSLLKLNTSHILISQYSAQDKPAWDCLKEICDLTCPRFYPWMIFVDNNGLIHFEEINADAPAVKRFVDRRDFLTCDLTNTSQNISTVVRAEGTCYTDEGDQSVTALAFNMKNIHRYGQTQPLLLDQHLTYNCRQMTTTQAVSFLNMLVTSVLGQVSEPTLTLQADIWPDPSLEINDKVQIQDTELGLKREFMITAINEKVDPGKYGMQITATECIYSANYLTGLPGAVTYDALLLPAQNSVPSTSLIKEIRLGSGQGTYVYKDWLPVQDPITLEDIYGKWRVADGSDMHFDVTFDAKKPPSPGANPWSYRNLPPNCSWAPFSDPNTGDTVYIGNQGPSGQGTPSNPNWTTYVGPDSVFYSYSHAGDITPGDLGSFWLPPGNSHGPGSGGGTQEWYGFRWAWWYLCLDGNVGTGKAYRPVMRPDPSGDATKFHVASGGSHQDNMTWSHPPGPPASVNCYYYGNIAAAISNITPTPDGFVGVKVFNSDGRTSHGKTAVNWSDGNPYWSSGKNGGPGWMPIGTVHVPVFDPTAVIPGDEVSIGSGGHLEPTVPIVHVDVGGGTIEIDSSYNGGGGTKQPHYGGPLGQPDSGGYPDAPVHVVSAGGGMPDDLLYGVAYGNPIPQRDNYMNYEKITTGMFCVLVMSTDGAVQFVRVPFRVYL